MIGQDASKQLRRIGGRLARLGGQSARYDWQAWFRRNAARRPVEEILTAHANAHLLEQDFNVGAYLEKNADVADAVESAGEAAFHYLEFGHAEGRNGAPEEWSRSFVRLFHGISLPDDRSAEKAHAALRRAGVSAAVCFLNESGFWLSLGLHGPVLSQVFEHEYYLAAAEAAGLTLPQTDRLNAIRHFAAIGLEHGVPPHPLHRLDLDFYRSALDLAEIEPPERTDAAGLRRHWARIGLRAGLHANPKAWFRAEAETDLPEAVLSDLEAFAAASPDLDMGATLPQRLQHLISVPMPGASAFDRGADGVSGFLIDLARHMRLKGEPGTAEWLLARVLDAEPGNARANLDLANLIHGQKRVGTEIQLRQTVPAGFDMGANQMTLAELLLAQKRFADVLDIAESLPDTVFGNVSLRRRRRELGRAVFDQLWSTLGKQIERRDVSDLQGLLLRALELYTPPFTAPVRSTPIRRIAILANEDLYQCKLYRADQKADQLRHAGYAVTVFAQGRDVGLLRDRLDQFDAVIFMRVPAFPDTIYLIVDAAQQGLATFYDADDLIFDTELFPPPLETYAGQITKRDHQAMACGVPLFGHAVRLCDYGIASTETIRGAMQRFVRSGQVFLHRNALGGPHLRAIAQVDTVRRRQQEKVVIYYGSGTKAHKAEFHEILEPALAKLLKERPGQVEIRIIGAFTAFDHLDPGHPDIRLIEPIWDFEAFCLQVAEADINLSILAPSLITDAKSEIKWIEASMFGIPSVVSPTATHREVIENGVNGFLCSDTDEFGETLLKLVDDPDLRTRVGAAAREKVLRDYGLPAMGENLDRIFEAVRPRAAAETKKRLLIVNVFYPPQDIGGATRVVKDNIADLIAEHGTEYDIDVVATLEGGEEPHQVKCYARDGVRVWTITAREGIDTMAVQDRAMADVFDRLLDRIAPDLVHFHCVQRLTASVVDVTRRRDIPYLITLHDGWWISPNQFIVAPSGLLETYDFRAEAAEDLPERGRITLRCLRDAEALLAVSDAFADVHRSVGLDKVETVENGLSVLPERVPAPGPAGRVRLGHIGGAARHKGYALLRAAIESRDFKNLDLVILDHALALGQTRHETWNTTPVTFLPRVPLDRVGEVYGKIDVLLAPSTWPESYGLVTREAMALGLWVVASDMGAIGQDVIEGETGHIVPVEDHRALAECLARIDAAPETYRGSPATRPALRPASAQAKELAAIYARVLSRRSPDTETGAD